MWAMSYLAMIAAPRMHCLRCVWKDPQLQKEDAFFRVFQWTHVPIYRLIMANHNHGPMPGVKIKMIYLPTYLSIYLSIFLSIYILILWPDLGVYIYINRSIYLFVFSFVSILALWPDLGMFIYTSFYLSNSVTCKYPNPVTGLGSVYIHI